MMLEHYGPRPVEKIRSDLQRPPGRAKWAGKPEGLWVSVAGADDWPSWCREQDFELDRLACRHIVTLSPDADILYIRSVSDLDVFDQAYGLDLPIAGSELVMHVIDWPAVAAGYDGVIIAPYQWGRRLDGPVSRWYYGWDCASGVIWNGKAASIELAQPQAVAA